MRRDLVLLQSRRRREIFPTDIARHPFPLFVPQFNVLIQQALLHKLLITNVTRKSPLLMILLQVPMVLLLVDARLATKVTYERGRRVNALLVLMQ